MVADRTAANEFAGTLENNQGGEVIHHFFNAQKCHLDMMTGFAKLFQLTADSQVLLTKDYEEEQSGREMWKVIQCTAIDGVKAQVALSFYNEDKADQCWLKYGKSDAEKFYTAMKKVLQSD